MKGRGPRGGPCPSSNDQTKGLHMSPFSPTIPAWDIDIISRELDPKFCRYRVIPALAYPARWGRFHGPVSSP